MIIAPPISHRTDWQESRMRNTHGCPRFVWYSWMGVVTRSTLTFRATTPDTRPANVQRSMYDARDAAPVSPPRDAACTSVVHGKRRTSPGPAPRRREANPRSRPRLEVHLSRVVNIVNRPCQSSPARALGRQPQMRAQMQMHAR